MRDRPSRRSRDQERGGFDDSNFGRSSFDDAVSFDRGHGNRSYAGAPSPSFGAPAQSYSGAPRRPTAPVATRFSVKAEVKWFSSEKGFGFATSEGGGDVFVHGAVVRSAGREALEPGDRIVVDIAPSDRGEKAVTLHSVEPGEPSDGGRRPLPQPSHAAKQVSVQQSVVGSILGIVKWYSAIKGFGFVAPDDGSKDVFLHATALERSGVSPESLRDGTRIKAEIITGRQGKTEIGTFRLA